MTIPSTKSTLFLALVLLAPMLTACDDDVTGLDESRLVGDYTADVLLLTDPDGQTTDALAEGGSLDLTLAGDGTISGLLVTPPSLSESGEQEEESIDGTWTLSGRTVTFDEETSDTFLEDVAFTADVAANTAELEGMETFSTGFTVEAVLIK